MLCTKIAKLDWNARPWLAGSPRLTMCASWCKHIHSHSLVQRRWLAAILITRPFSFWQRDLPPPPITATSYNPCNAPAIRPTSATLARISAQDVRRNLAA
jgi:hypothetical protein